MFRAYTTSAVFFGVLFAIGGYDFWTCVAGGLLAPIVILIGLFGGKA